MIKEILSFIFPPKCVFCGKLLPGDGRICTKCENSLPYTAGAGAKSTGDFFDFCVSPLYYEGYVRRSLINFKFRGKRHYSKTYASKMLPCINDHLYGKFDIITWVPVSRKRLHKRGYDQAQLLAEAIAGYYNIPCIPLLEKSRDNPPQSTITGTDKRRANVSGVYHVKNGSDISGRKILLVDDIITTGSTISECSRMLLMAGAENIVCAAVAKKRMNTLCDVNNQ